MPLSRRFQLATSSIVGILEGQLEVLTSLFGSHWNCETKFWVDFLSLKNFFPRNYRIEKLQNPSWEYFSGLKPDF